MKSIHSPAIASLLARATGAAIVLRVLEEAGFDAHLVGGAVRDTLMGRPAKDLDIATSARPEAVTSLFEARGYAVHATGIEHGTVTVVAADTAIEVTTWRLDVATDGRRATIAYATRLEEDAERRDLTVNALYAGLDGTVLDPVGQGLDDIASGRIRFVGQARQRIAEDRLRILRFWRFAASHGDVDLSLSSPDGEVCMAEAASLAAISRERVGAEVMKLLVGAGAAPVVAALAERDVLRHVLPGTGLSIGVESGLARLGFAEKALGLRPSAEARLALLTKVTPVEELRLSRKQAILVETLRSAHDLFVVGRPEEVGYRFGEETGARAAAMAYSTGSEGAIAFPQISALRYGSAQTFPVKAADLPGHLKGRQIGEALRALEVDWVESGFQLRDAVLDTALAAQPAA